MVDCVKDENPVQLDPEQFCKHRSHVARCLFFSQDTADTTIAVNELRQQMSDPSQHRFFQIKATRSVLEGRERQWMQVFEFGDMSSEVTVFSGSDWAGDKETRKSSSAGGRARGTTPDESVYKKTEDHRQRQCRSRTTCSSIGSVRSEGGPEHDV